MQEVVAHGELLDRAQALAEEWIAKGVVRKYRDPAELGQLKAVNAKESIGVADSFLSVHFMQAQFKFLWSKNKRGPAAMFFAMWASRPLWSRLLKNG